MESLNRRREMGGSKDCPYQRIEYLEVSEEGGQAWIDTEYIPQGGKIYDIYAAVMILGYNPSSNAYIKLLGAGGDTKEGYRIVRHWDDYIIALYDGGQANAEMPSALYNIEFGCKYSISMFGTSQTYKINEISGVLKYVAPTGANKYNFLVFDQEGDFYGRIYSVKLVKSGEEILDLLPVRIGDEGYMYDRVSGKLFGNSGTGKFILGPDIN